MNSCTPSFLSSAARNCFVLVLAAGWLTLPGPAAGADRSQQMNAPRKPKTEAELLKDLESRQSMTVNYALGQIEDRFPTSPAAIAGVKKLLKDSRPNIRRKAARVLGVIHAEVNEENLEDIAGLLRSTDVGEIIDGLKALRGLNAASKIPMIVPFLKHSDTHVVRDSCRTLAELGGKEHVPLIEPLLQHKDEDVRKDAWGAIVRLRRPR